MTDTARRRHVVIGTAGHIDHGKTSLIKALTGRDLDRLEEEKRRGITIELGFAFYGDSAAFVDVPGHEKLVKTMIAGASAMSAALLVIAADDGVMPQTREHLAVLNALGVKRGIVVVTKADLVDNDWLELVVEEARELLAGTPLEGSPVIAVDSLSGRGIPELRAELDQLVALTPPHVDEDFFRLPIDRSFVIKGHGRVVTGTVWNGSATAGDKLRLLPGGEAVRVRGLQAHEQSVEHVFAGDRAALNLTTDAEPERGQMLISHGRGVATDFLDAALHLTPDARPLKQRARVRVHLGTAEVIGRLLLVGRDTLMAGDRAHVRIALEASLPAMHGDLGVLRFYSPTQTLGGIRVLDPAPPDRKRNAPALIERLRRLDGETADVIETMIEARTVSSLADLLSMIPIRSGDLERVVNKLVEQQRIRLLPATRTVIWERAWMTWKLTAAGTLQKYHQTQPNEPGMPAGALLHDGLGGFNLPEVGEALLTELTADGVIHEEGGLARLPGFAPVLTDADQRDAGRVHALLLAAAYNPPAPSNIAEELGLAESRVRALLKALKNVGRAVILEDKVVLAAVMLEQAKSELHKLPAEFKLNEVTAALNTSRKIAAPLMEFLDKQGFTVRDGDMRRIVGVDS